MSSAEDADARHAAPDLSMLADPLTLINLGVALTEIFTFLAEPRNVLNTSAACRRWRSLADDPGPGTGGSGGQQVGGQMRRLQGTDVDLVDSRPSRPRIGILTPDFHLSHVLWIQ